MPKSNDPTSKNLIAKYNYLEYFDKYDEIYELISKEIVYNGKFEEKFKSFSAIGQTIDEMFLKQINDWRVQLGQELFNIKGGNIEDINIELDDNIIYGLIGKSGSGKTTLLELIDGLLKPTRGKILVNGIESTKKENKKNIGFVFQFPEEQFFEVTVKKEIEFALKNFKIKKLNAKDALKLVGLKEEYLDKKLNELSSGEARLVAIASVLVYNPKIILFDEPTIGLDCKNKKKLIKIIKKLKNEYGKTIIIVSHDIDLLYEISERIIAIGDCKIILYGDTDSVFSETKLIKKYDIPIPNIIKFENLVRTKKNIKLMHTKSINDLIKEVYRNV